MFVRDVTIILAAAPEKSSKIKKIIEFHGILFGPSEVTRLWNIKLLCMPHKAKYEGCVFYNANIERKSKNKTSPEGTIKAEWYKQ